MDSISLSSSVSPRANVLDRIVVDAMFAANLEDVIRGGAVPVYGEPARFLAQASRRSGFLHVLNAVFGRLSGNRAGDASTLRLDMRIDGSNTHNLLAPYHAAMAGLPARTASEDPRR